MIRALGAAALLTVTLTAVGPASAAAADEVEQVVNGGFTSGTDPWWSTAGMPITLRDGKACVDVPGGTTNRWDASVGQNDIDLIAGESYRYSFTASGDPDGHIARAIVGLSVAPYDTYFEASPALTVAGDTYSFTFTANVTTTQAQVALQVGGSPTAWGLCLDDVSLVGGVPPEVYVPDTGPRVRVNQVAYLPRGPKKATLVTAATTRLGWQLRNAAGATVARGHTVPRGVDVSSGQNVQSIDFGGYRGRGTGYTLVADGETSRPFDIDAAAYERLRLDALKFYYPQRSGIEIRDDLRPGYARPASHVGVAPNLGDVAVPCQPGVCDYTLNVAGWLVRRRRPRQVRRQRRHLHLGTAQPVRAHHGAGPAARRHPGHPGERQPGAGHPRRGPLGTGVHAEHAGAGRQAARRHGAPQDPRRQLDRPAAAAAPRPAAARTPPGLDRGDPEPGRHRRAGRPDLQALRPRVRQAGPRGGTDRVHGRAGRARPLRARVRRDRRRRVQRQQGRRRLLLGGGRAVPDHGGEAVRRRRAGLTRAHRRHLRPRRLRLGEHGRGSAASTSRWCRTGCPGARRSARRSSAARRSTCRYRPGTRTASRTPQRTTCGTGARTACCSTTWWWSRARTSSPAATGTATA
nr:hypothetical protein GCM10020092_045330 [Actinoplanes digitatis]